MSLYVLNTNSIYFGVISRGFLWGNCTREFIRENRINIINVNYNVGRSTHCVWVV